MYIRDNYKYIIMNKLKYTLSILFIFFTLFANSQITIYNTYEDYKNNKGKTYEGFQYQTVTNKNFKMLFKANGTKTVISTKDIWGFKYKDAIFRVDRTDNQPARIVSDGKIVYYENGHAHVNMLKNYSAEATVGFGHFCYLSKDLESDFVPMPAYLVSKAKQKLKAFKDENPQYNDLFDCIEKDYDYKKVRTCVAAFEEVK